jgi:hypothetical protein
VIQSAVRKWWRRLGWAWRAYFLISLASVLTSLLTVALAPWKDTALGQIIQALSVGFLPLQLGTVLIGLAKTFYAVRVHGKRLDREIARSNAQVKLMAQRIKFTTGLQYLVKPDLSAIMCLTCGMVSHNPNDIREKYCGNCHRFLIAPGKLS